MFSNAKVGDKVYDIRYGWVEINEIYDGLYYPIAVKYEDITVTYTKSGYYSATQDFPMLYWDKPEIIAPPKPLPDLKIDTPILVKDEEDTEWSKRYFAGWSEKGKIMCWANGKTSWTADTDYPIIWDEWKLPEVNNGNN